MDGNSATAEIRLREFDEVNSITNWKEILDVLGMAVHNIEIAEAAKETCIELISTELSKARVVVTRKDKNENVRLEDENLFRWDVQPNDFQTASDFWHLCGRKLLSSGECLIIPLNGKYYIADSYQKKARAFVPSTFCNIQIKMLDGQSLALRKEWQGDNVIYIAFDRKRMDRKVKLYLDGLCEIVDNIGTAIMAANAPKLVLEAQASVSLVNRESGKKITLREYADELKNLLDTRKMSIVTTGNGMSLKALEIKANSTMEDLNKAIANVERAIAQSYRIPWTVYQGTVTEKSDAWADFMSGAVLPYARAIERALNGAVVGKKDFRKGERIWFTLAYNRFANMLGEAVALEKLIGIGKTLDEVDEMLGLPPAGTQETRSRALTKNFERGKDSDS